MKFEIQIQSNAFTAVIQLLYLGHQLILVCVSWLSPALKTLPRQLATFQHRPLGRLPSALQTERLGLLFNQKYDQS